MLLYIKVVYSTVFFRFCPCLVVSFRETAATRGYREVKATHTVGKMA